MSTEIFRRKLGFDGSTVATLHTFWSREHL